MTSNPISTGPQQAAASAMANQGTSSATAQSNNNVTISISNQNNNQTISQGNTQTTNTSNLDLLHRAPRSNSSTATYSYLQSFAVDPRELRLAKARDRSKSEQDTRVEAFENEIKQLREIYKNTKDANKKAQIKEEIPTRLNKLMKDELTSLENLVKAMEEVIDSTAMRKNRGAAFTAKTITQEQAMSFLNKIANIDRSNSDIENKIDQGLYQKIAAIAVGGLLSTKAADVMRKALQTDKPFDPDAEFQSPHNKQSMIAVNDARMDTIERTLDINCGAIEGDYINRGEIPTITTDLVNFITKIDYNRILAVKFDNPPIAITKVAEFFKRLDTKSLALIQNYEQVLKITLALGLKPELVQKIGSETNEIRKTVERTLGTVFTEKHRESVNEILLRQSHSSLAEMRRAAAKTGLHALVMAYNRNFNENPHYQQDENATEPLWQKIAYESINHKYQAALTSSNPNEVKNAEETILRELSIIANELRANSQDPFRLHRFAKNRKFEAELANLLQQCLHSTEPEQVNMALSLLSSVFSTTSVHTAHIFNRGDDPKSQNKKQQEQDAKAALWMFETLFQNKLINASKVKDFNQESLEKFFKGLMQNKHGQGANPALSILFNFIKSSMIADESLSKDPDKEKTLQRAEKYALYLYYLVMRYMPIDSKDSNNLHYMRLFSELYLDSNFRKQLKEELSDAEVVTKDSYNLMDHIDTAHRSKVNVLAKALEDDITAKINTKATNNEIYRICKEYIELEHDLRKLATHKDHLGEVNIGNTKEHKANQYKMAGFEQLLTKLYDHNKNLALKLYEYYATCRAQDGKVNSEALKGAGQVLGQHIVKRLKENQNRIKVDNSINSIVDDVAKEDGVLMTNERYGVLYNKLRDHAMRVKLSKTNLKPEVKAIVHQQVMKQETIRGITPFKNNAGHVIIDSKHEEDLNAIQDIYEDVLILAKTFPDTINAILNQPALSQTRAILNAQFIGINRVEITDKNESLSNKLEHTNANYAELNSLGITPTRAIKSQHLRLAKKQIEEFSESAELTARKAKEAIGQDSEIAFSA